LGRLLFLGFWIIKVGKGELGVWLDYRKSGIELDWSASSPSAASTSQLPDVSNEMTTVSLYAPEAS
jgi:hypothetical protein